MDAAGDEPGEMRHVHHEVGADLVGNRAKAGKIDETRIGRTAGDDNLRPVLPREHRHLRHVDALVVAAHAIGHDVKPLARHIDRGAMGEMAAGGKIKPHESIAGLHQREEGRGIGGRAGMRLDVGKATSEEPRNPFDRERFCDVDELAAAVVALAGQAFGIFVGEDRALGLEHRAADDVLRRYQLDPVTLAAKLEPDRLGNLRIALGKRRGKEGPGLGRLRLLHDELRTGGRRMFAVPPRRAGDHRRDSISLPARQVLSQQWWVGTTCWGRCGAQLQRRCRLTRPPRG